VNDTSPIVMQVYCRVEIRIDDPEVVLAAAERELRTADIDWSREVDTVEEAVAELRGDLAMSVASLVEPYRMLDDVPGMEFRGGTCWAEVGPPSDAFRKSRPA
jgi:hypothetical protein